jgi:DNA-binding response OmpR family regulator
MKRLNLRIALVIEPADALRSSALRFLRRRGWIVHGVRRAELAFPILPHIPYNLIVISSELPGMTAVEFVRILKGSRELQTIALAVITEASSRALNAKLIEFGVFLAKKPRWKDDLSRFLVAFDDPANCKPTLGLQKGAQHVATAMKGAQ